jgi:hypothetical protein
VVRYFGDSDEIADVRQAIVSQIAMEELKKGTLPTEEELIRAMDRAEEKLRQRKDILIEVVKDIAVDGIEAEVIITNEKLDVGTTARNLLEMMQLIPEEARAETAAEVFNVLGLKVPTALRTTPLNVSRQPQLQVPNELGQFTEANTKMTMGH